MRTPPQPPRGPAPSRGPAPPSPVPPKTAPRGSAPPKALRAQRPAPSTAPRRTPRPIPDWLQRARQLMRDPAVAWRGIAAEFTTPGPIFRGFVVPTAAIGPVAATLGTLVFGVHGVLLDTYKMAALDALTLSVLQYLLSLAGVYALAFVIDALAPTFASQRNAVQALKVAAYGPTPYWLGGALAVIPKLGWLGLVVGLYSVRVLALGLPVVMKTPRDKAAAYTAVVVSAGVLLALLARAIPSILVG